MWLDVACSCVLSSERASTIAVAEEVNPVVLLIVGTGFRAF